MPPRGTVIESLRSKVSQYSEADQKCAERCARRYGIKRRIGETK
jgi:hypothetical protein